MIVTVTPNAAIDRSLVVPNVRLGRRHRAVEQTTLAGGKGVNVARILKALGQPVIATGFAGGAAGTRIVEQLTRESILNDFVRIEDESRTNTAVFDPTTGGQTEINERGPRVSEAELDLFREKLTYLARGAGMLVLAGSLPRDVPADLYADIVREMHRLGVRTFVDCEGEVLRHALKAEPGMVSPNQVEAEEVVGHEFVDDADRVHAIGELRELGARDAVITLPDGGVAGLQDGREDRLVRARIDEREAVGRIGAGDAFLAGFVAATYEGRPPGEALRFGVACGAESTQRIGAGLVEPREVERLLHEVEVAPASTPDVD